MMLEIKGLNTVTTRRNLTPIAVGQSQPQGVWSFPGARLEHEKA